MACLDVRSDRARGAFPGGPTAPVGHGRVQHLQYVPSVPPLCCLCLCLCLRGGARPCCLRLRHFSTLSHRRRRGSPRTSLGARFGPPRVRPRPWPHRRRRPVHLLLPSAPAPFAAPTAPAAPIASTGAARRPLHRKQTHKTVHIARREKLRQEGGGGSGCEWLSPYKEVHLCGRAKGAPAEATGRGWCAWM